MSASYITSSRSVFFFIFFQIFPKTGPGDWTRILFLNFRCHFFMIPITHLRNASSAEYCRSVQFRIQFISRVSFLLHCVRLNKVHWECSFFLVTLTLLTMTNKNAGLDRTVGVTGERSTNFIRFAVHPSYVWTCCGQHLKYVVALITSYR